MRIVWEPLIARELERQAQEALYRTSYPDTWTVEAGAADDDDDGDSSSKFPTFKLVHLLAPLPDGAEAAGGSGGKTGLERLRSRCNVSTWREAEFVADVWGRSMDVDLIVQITRVQNTMQYDQFDQQRKVGSSARVGWGWNSNVLRAPWSCRKQPCPRLCASASSLKGGRSRKGTSPGTDDDACMQQSWSDMCTVPCPAAPARSSCSRACRHTCRTRPACSTTPASTPPPTSGCGTAPRPRSRTRYGLMACCTQS